MGANAGPDIVSDGLVLALDAADNNSFRGEPTENLFPNPQFTNHTNNSTGAASITKKTFENGKVGIEMIQASTSDIVSFSMGNLGSTGVSGGTYTWSSYINCTSTGNKVKAQVSIYVDGVRNWLTNSNTWTTSVTECSHLFSPTVANAWHRVENTFTLPTGTLTNFSLGGFYRNTSNFTLRIADAQLELNSKSTRFTSGTRGTTVATGGGWADISGNSNHGEILNGTSTSNDNTVLGALDFDGTNDYIDISGVDFGAGPVSISAWIYKDSNAQASAEAVISKSESNKREFHLRIEDSPQNGIYFWKSDTGSGAGNLFDTNVSISLNQWQHIVVTMNTTNVEFYLNGSNVKSYSGSYTLFNGNGKIRVGGWSEGGGYYFNGLITNVNVYNRALTSTEAVKMYNTQKSRFGL